MKRVLAVFLIFLGNACGSSPTQPSTVQVAGLWNGTAQVTSVSGGECVGALIALNVPAAITASITQTGSSLTAVVTSQGTGTACSYSGTAGSASVSMNLTSCQTGTRTLQCGNGSVRVASIIGGSLNGTVTGNSFTGTSADTWNITTTATVPVATMTINGSFAATKQ